MPSAARLLRFAAGSGRSAAGRRTGKLSTQPPTPSPARSHRPAGRTPLAFLALAGTCVVAAGVGGYLAQSPRTAELPSVEARQAQPAPVTVRSASPARSSSPAATIAAPVERTTIPPSTK